MKNNIDLFEKDNWLEEQRRLESRVSFWDLDEGKKIRYEHAENCDVKDNAQTHHQRHLVREKVNYRSVENVKKPGLDVTWFVIDLFLFIFLIVVAPVFDSDFHYLAIGLMFLGFTPAIILSYIFFRRFPSNRYWIILFIITVVIEVFATVMHVMIRY